MVVLHYTAMQSAQAACDTLCNPANEVSAHYLIAEDGTVMQLVAEDQRAWHAGAGRWGSVTDVNSRSIGIELANPGNCPFSAPLMDALVPLLRAVMERWDIPAHRVIGHSDMAPGRKIDPGARFDWRHLARERVSVWPDYPTTSAVPAEPVAFDAAAIAFGYAPDITHDLRLAAFRLRFRPGQQGPVTASDVTAITDLARRFPVDASRVTA